jgi:predicted nucleic acid-binding protein
MGLIYLDTCLVIYLAERHPRWRHKLAGAMTAAKNARFAISPLVKMECMVGALRRDDPVLQQEYMDLFATFAWLPMPDPVYLQAAQLRARFELKTPDALHLACAQHHRCEALWTNDGRLTQASHGLARRIPK